MSAAAGRGALLGLLVVLAVFGLMRLSAHGAAADHDAALRLLRSGGPECAAHPAATPCAFGIVPGVTPRGEAHALLRAHPWVAVVFETREALSWKWSGQQPALIDPGFDGVVGFDHPLPAAGTSAAREPVAALIRFGVLAGFGDAWLAYGPPEHAQLVRPVSFSTAYQIGGYGPAFGGARSSVQTIVTLACRRSGRAQVAGFWNAPFTLGFGDVWYTELINGAHFDVYGGAWWERVRTCRPQPR
jgi:hypothetical protein